MVSTYWDIFEKSSRLFADSKAIILLENGVHVTYSYGKLFDLSNKLFNILLPILCPGETIGICLEHNVFIPVLLAVIHRCHCSFIFLNTNETENRQSTTISELGINSFFSSSKKINYASFICNEIPSMDSILNDKLYLWTKKDRRLATEVINNLAYFIKTSGSTSIAKNVAVTHESIYPNICDFKRIFNVTNKDIIYFSTPLTFDPSIIEIYLAAYCGAALLISYPYSNLLYPLTEKYPITIWQTTPSVLLNLGLDIIQNTLLCSLSQLKVLALGGEPFLIYEKLFELKHKENKTEIFNLYGITEVSCWASVFNVDFKSTDEITDISIGNPLSDTVLQILDDNLKPITTGIGNIFIGSCIRKCLIGEETECLLDNSIKILNNSDMLWRKTGDIGEIKNNNLIYFRGRSDDIIKRFGTKVSIVELENAALKFLGIEQCTCLWFKETHALIMFFTSKVNTKEDLYFYLRKSLAAIQIPDDIIQLQEMPITSHGKISKRKIYECFKSVTKSNGPCHIDFTEKKNKLKIFLSEILSMKDLENKESCSFIELGGNSIMAIQLVNKFENYTKKHYAQLFPSLLNDTVSISNLLNLLDCDATDITFVKAIPNINNKTSHNEELHTTVSLENKKRKLNETSIDAMLTGDSYSFEVAWKIDLNKCVDASPILYNFRDKTFLLVGSHSGKVAVIEAKSGLEVHMLNVSSRVEASILCFDNIDHEPHAVVGDYSGCVWCFSILDAKVFWTVSLDAMIKSQACHLNSNVYVASYKGVVSEIDEKGGKILSSISIGNSGITADLLASRMGFIFVASLNGTCTCLVKKDGIFQIKWANNLPSPVFAKPAFIHNESRIIFTEVNGILHCFDSLSGSAIWTFTKTGGLIFSSCALAVSAEKEYLVFGCHDNHTYRLAVEENQPPVVLNKITLTSEVYSTPCCFKEFGIISISTDGNIIIIDSRLGHIKAQYKLPGKVFSSPAASDDSVYVGCRDNYVYCLRIVKKENELNKHL